MKSQWCAVADRDEIGMAEPLREQLRAMCPGLLQSVDGPVIECDGGAHAGVTRKAREAAAKKKGALPLAVPEAPNAPEETPQVSKKAGKRPPAGEKRGRCEHCGAPTGGRFAVGHDAKLKSELTSLGHGGDADAWAEMLVRDWARLVDRHKWPKPPVVAAAEKLAFDEGQFLVARRNKARQNRSS